MYRAGKGGCIFGVKRNIRRKDVAAEQATKGLKTVVI